MDDHGPQRVLVTGPEGSGTHMLASLIAALGIEVVNRSLPYAGVWWRYPTDPEGGVLPERSVIITRRPDVRNLALLGRKPPLVATITEARAAHDRALRALARIPDAYWLCYEAVCAEPLVQMANVADWLGVPVASELPPVHDANAKWLSFLEP